MTTDARAYAITIRRDFFAGEELFEARTREFPDLVAYGATSEEARELIIDAIETTAEAFAESGRSLPQPLATPGVVPS